jgi:hypothetical protein
VKKFEGHILGLTSGQPIRGAERPVLSGHLLLCTAIRLPGWPVMMASDKPLFR